MYNPNVAEHSRFYRSPFLLAAAFLAIAIAVITTFIETTSPVNRAVTFVMYGCMALIVALFRSGHNLRHVHVYLAIQTSIAFALIYLLPKTDSPLILINVLCVQAAILLPPRSVAKWFVIFIAVTGFGLVRLQGDVGFVTLVGQSIGLFAFTVVGGALRQAEITRQQSQVLLAELNEAHSQLQDYAAQAQKLAVAEERNRLARDLHDSVKQQAFALSAQLGAARALIQRDPQAAEARLHEAEQLSDGLRQELAAMILELRPPSLKDKGLAAALQDYAAGWGQQHGIAIEVTAPGDVAARPEVEQAFFRITQEALTNIARHSHARRATLRLEQEGGNLSLHIADDGTGFDTQSVKSGVGLQSMAERMAALNGTISIDSTPGQGTRITAQAGNLTP